MKHIVCFSGGKDSTALILWAKENLGNDFTTIFCDTGWEHPITYAYVEEINQTVLGGKLLTLKSNKYSGFIDLSVSKQMIPSVNARYCTLELKVLPMIDWLKTIDDDCVVFQGVRSDESKARANLPENQWSDEYDALIVRPLLHWTARQCFALAQRHGVKPNPLYLMGATRIGCFPCIMITTRDLHSFRQFPEQWNFLKRRVLELEQLVGRSFWRPADIPERFHTGYDKSSGKSFPWAQDVFRYVESVDETQLPLFTPRNCMSVYNLCE